jgi:hypothetical protein
VANNRLMAKRSNMSKSVTRRGKWEEKFLLELAQRGIVKGACEAANVGQTTAYVHREKDKDFAAAWLAALDTAADVLVREVWRRAHDGVDEPVTHLGQQSFVALDKDGKPTHDKDKVASVVPFTIKKYSDTLLMFLLKKMRPEYREHHHHPRPQPRTANPR